MDISELLQKYKLRPDKRLGQNFLVEPLALQRVVEAADIQPCETVLEIGPGLGNLTGLLAEKARRVVAVELDQSLISPLKEILASYSNVQVLQGDILAFDPTELVREIDSERTPDYLVVANIPYYITSALVRHLLEASHPPNRLVLTVQREVAERICAAPGEMSLLALSVQVYGRPKVTAILPASAFYPSPKVDSSIIRVDLYSQPLISRPLLTTFFQLAKAGFSQKRKTLRNALAGGMRWTPKQAQAVLNAAGIDDQRRAQTVSLEEWGKLAEIVQQPPTLSVAL